MTPKLALVQPQASDPNSLVPVQMIFVLKAKNAKKINCERDFLFRQGMIKSRRAG